MKRLSSIIGSAASLLAFGALIVITVFVFQGMRGGFGSAAQASPVPVEDQGTVVGYPAPDSSSTQALPMPVETQPSSAYPGPLPTLVVQETPKSEWQTYSDTKAGLSFEYPSLARLDEFSAKPNDFKTVFIFVHFGDSNGGCAPNDTIVISTLANPDKLSAKQFVEQGLASAQYATEIAPKQNTSFDILENDGKTASVAGQEALWIDNGPDRGREVWDIIGLANPVVFVPYDTHIFSFSISPHDPMGVYEPCTRTTDVFKHILDTLSLSSTQK